MAIQMSIHNNAMFGKGTDQSGPFEMHGQYDAESHIVTIEKIYPWLLVLYSGKWNGSFIAGTWTIPGDDNGVFEMWPLEEELPMDTLTNQRALPHGAIPALPGRRSD